MAHAKLVVLCTGLLLVACTRGEHAGDNSTGMLHEGRRGTTPEANKPSQVLRGVYESPHTEPPLESLGKPTKENLSLVDSHLSLAEIERLVGPGSEDIPEDADPRTAAAWERQRVSDSGGRRYWWSNGQELLLMEFGEQGDVVFSQRNYSTAFSERQLGQIEIAPGEEVLIDIQSPVDLIVGCDLLDEGAADPIRQADNGRIELSAVAGPKAFGPRGATQAIQSENGKVRGILRNQYRSPVTVEVSFEPDRL